MRIKINSRYVKEENGLRLFQKETLEAIKNPSAKLIFVEAPVGSGKSYVKKWYNIILRSLKPSEISVKIISWNRIIIISGR